TTTPDWGTETLSLDGRGYVQRSERHGHTSEYTYNALGRPLTATGPAAAGFAYDDAGNLTTLSPVRGGQLTINRDSRFLPETIHHDGRKTAIGFDDGGALTTLTPPLQPPA